jgi:D-alanyl-D-alanine carboxypeptidase
LIVRRAFGCLVMLALLTSGCGGGSEPERPAVGPRLTAAVARELDAQLRSKVQDTGVPGAVAAVVFSDGRMWTGAAGLAVLEPARRMTRQTAVPFASITKVATAALAMRLVEQGRLRLDDPIVQRYPRWRGDREATVRDLLGHTAGVGDPPDAFFARLGRHPERVSTDRDYIAATPTPGPRTTTAEYSNTGFMIVGQILERAARQPVAAAMRQEIFDHAGGDGLAFQPAERADGPLVHCYWYPEGAGDPVDLNDGSRLLPLRGEATMASTAGALAGDVPSLARWAHELFEGRIVQRRSLQEMARFHDGGHWEGYGLGLARSTHEDRVMWGHGGDGFGSATDLWHLPREKLTIAITWNDDLIDSTDGNFRSALLRAALAGVSRNADSD